MEAESRKKDEPGEMGVMEDLIPHGEPMAVDEEPANGALEDLKRAFKRFMGQDEGEAEEGTAQREEAPKEEPKVCSSPPTAPCGGISLSSSQSRPDIDPFFNRVVSRNTVPVGDRVQDALLKVCKERATTPRKPLSQDIFGAEEQEEDADKMSKKKRKQLERMKVAELKRLCARPDVVELWDVNAPDPKLLVHLKGYRCVNVHTPHLHAISPPGLAPHR